LNYFGVEDINNKMEATIENIFVPGTRIAIIITATVLGVTLIGIIIIAIFFVSK
jgi:hypothetical protein